MLERTGKQGILLQLQLLAPLSNPFLQSCPLTGGKECLELLATQICRTVKSPDSAPLSSGSLDTINCGLLSTFPSQTEWVSHRVCRWSRGCSGASPPSPPRPPPPATRRSCWWSAPAWHSPGGQKSRWCTWASVTCFGWAGAASTSTSDPLLSSTTAPPFFFFSDAPRCIFFFAFLRGMARVSVSDITGRGSPFVWSKIWKLLSECKQNLCLKGDIDGVWLRTKSFITMTLSSPFFSYSTQAGIVLIKRL